MILLVGYSMFMTPRRCTYEWIQCLMNNSLPLYAFQTCNINGWLGYRTLNLCKPNSNPKIEHTGDPSGENEQYPSNTNLPIPKTRHSNIDLAYLSNAQQQESYKMNTPHIQENCTKANPQSIHNQQLIHIFFTSVLNRPMDNFNHSEYLNIAHELKGDKELEIWLISPLLPVGILLGWGGWQYKVVVNFLFNLHWLKFLFGKL